MLIGESKLGLIFKVFSLLTLPLCFLTRTFIFKPLLFARKPLTSTAPTPPYCSR